MALSVALDLPKIYRIHQTCTTPGLPDIPGAVRTAFAEAGLADKIRPGQRIALTAGSRGVANIPIILRATAAAVRDAGGQPIVLPTMGSHGGATPQGQIEVLR